VEASGKILLIRPLLSVGKLFLLLIPATAALAWSCRPAALAVWAMARLPTVTLTAADWQDPARLLEMRRQVQRHFLASDVYIPMEDIVVSVSPEGAPADGAAPATSLPLLMQKACGQGRLYIWIPFKFVLPVTGEKVIEWCWKPQTKDA
jgi:hypothetical protein